VLFSDMLVDISTMVGRRRRLVDSIE